MNGTVERLREIEGLEIWLHFGGMVAGTATPDAMAGKNPNRPGLIDEFGGR